METDFDFFNVWDSPHPTNMFVRDLWFFGAAKHSKHPSTFGTNNLPKKLEKQWIMKAKGGFPSLKIRIDYGHPL